MEFCCSLTLINSVIAVRYNYTGTAAVPRGLLMHRHSSVRISNCRNGRWGWGNKSISRRAQSARPARCRSESLAQYLFIRDCRAFYESLAAIPREFHQNSFIRSPSSIIAPCSGQAAIKWSSNWLNATHTCRVASPGYRVGPIVMQCIISVLQWFWRTYGCPQSRARNSSPPLPDWICGLWIPGAQEKLAFRGQPQSPIQPQMS
jgi:hypothetical protein